MLEESRSGNWKQLSFAHLTKFMQTIPVVPLLVLLMIILHGVLTLTRSDIYNRKIETISYLQDLQVVPILKCC